MYIVASFLSTKTVLTSSITAPHVKTTHNPVDFMLKPRVAQPTGIESETVRFLFCLGDFIYFNKPPIFWTLNKS